MLEKLLDRITRDGKFSVQSLAQEFDVSKELIEAMLADLVRAGYLRRVEGCEGGECGRCRAAACVKPRAKVWVLAKSASQSMINT